MKRSLSVIMLMSLCYAPAADAATQKPTPKPTVKIKTQVTPAQSKTKTSAKPTPRATASSRKQTTTKTNATTKKPVVSSSKKATVKKKVVRKPRKPVRITPSPKPKWPPQGFFTDSKADKDVYARIPTTKELVGVISARQSLSKRVADCEKFACGAVQVASFVGCSWWEVTSTLYATDSQKTRRPLGNLRTLVGKSEPQQILTILLISNEAVAEGQIMDDISVNCHRDTPTDDFPFYSYSPITN